MDEIIPILGILGVIVLPVIAAFIIGIQLISSKHRERIAMIERGIALQEPEKREKKTNRYATLRNGLFMIGLSAGIICGIFMAPVLPDASSWEYFLIPTMAILCGGAGFVIYFFLSRKMQLKEKEEDRQSGFTE
ncbi:DUF6249 domain-containing protein [Parabacteroides sp. PF5-9]|uniref:DUF6249 domain-containing protein n=1 Tax=Parabacteroides sp. PF5-9 TaxID=1742404 RepID=UPI002474BCED|nr:DUF6249 domain-containing protein [Parabacteroides sp. PF5-9]MDH6356203.1 phosphotransferase system glucose/maltose/N-acetylglucosamine-specific IIC component [Parabacteroides sp. PF5-9]